MGVCHEISGFESILIWVNNQCCKVAFNHLDQKVPAPSVADPYYFYTDPDPGCEKITYGSRSGSGSRTNFDTDPEPGPGKNYRDPDPVKKG